MLDLWIAELGLYEERLQARIRTFLKTIADAEEAEREELRVTLKRCLILSTEASRAIEALRRLKAANFPAMPRFHVSKTVGVLVQREINDLMDVLSILDTRAEATRVEIVSDV